MKNDSQQITLFNDRKKRTTVTPEIIEKIKTFRQQRFNYEEIAGFTGVSISTVGRIVKENGLPTQKVYKDKEPAPVATGTSSDNTKNQNNNTPNMAVCKDLFEKAKTVLETSDTTTQLKDIGQALGLIEAGLALLEV